MIRIKCRGCGAVLQLADQQAGKCGTCPRCGTGFALRGAQPAPFPAQAQDALYVDLVPDAAPPALSRRRAAVLGICAAAVLVTGIAVALLLRDGRDRRGTSGSATSQPAQPGDAGGTFSLRPPGAVPERIVVPDEVLSETPGGQINPGSDNPDLRASQPIPTQSAGESQRDASIPSDTGKTDKQIIPWEGNCCVHDYVTPELLAATKTEYPRAKVMVHPECKLDVIKLGDYTCSTGQMITVSKNEPYDDWIVVTDPGMCERLRRESPQKKFHPVPTMTPCYTMNITTPAKVRDALLTLEPKIEVPEPVRVRAERALRRMIEL